VEVAKEERVSFPPEKQRAKQGWPDSQLCLPPQVQAYFPFKEELKLQNGFIFKGDRVLMPFQMRARSTGMPETSKGSFLLAWHV